MARPLAGLQMSRVVLQRVDQHGNVVFGDVEFHTSDCTRSFGEQALCAASEAIS